MAGDFSFHSQSSSSVSARGDARISDFPEPRTCVYSARLFQPFIRLLDQTSLIPAEWAQAMRSLDLDERMPAATAHQLLDGVLSLGVLWVMAPSADDVFKVVDNRVNPEA